MNNKRIVLLRKELMELIYNPKSGIAIVVVVGLMYLFHFLREDYRDGLLYFTVFFAALSVGQYVYDSFVSDIEFKGALFLHNTGISLTELFRIKLWIALVIATVILITTLPLTYSQIRLSDLFWIYPFVAFSCSLMQIFTVLARGRETTASVIAAIGILATMLMLQFFHSHILRAVVMISLHITFMVLAEQSLKMLNVRTQL